MRGPSRVSREEHQRFESFLLPGHYRLSADFVGSRVYKRLAGPGWESRNGFQKGTRFTIREAVWTYEDRLLQQATSWELSPVFLGYTHAVRGQKKDDESFIVWTVRPNIDVGRLLGLLVPDTSDETWLDHAVGHEARMGGCFAEVLLSLLVSGRVSRTEISEIVRENHEALVARERERRREISAGAG